MPSNLGARLWSGGRKYFWIISVLVLALDQLTKVLLSRFAPETEDGITIVPGFLRLIAVRHNLSGAFSLGPQWASFYVVATLGGLVLVGWLFATAPAGRIRPNLALGFVCGGALGNLIDRLAIGAVRDFIDLHWRDKAHWPTFNLADAAICIGVGLLLVEALLTGGKGKPGEEQL